MHASTVLSSMLIALALPACVLHTKLIDNPAATDSDSDNPPTSNGTTTTGGEGPSTTFETSPTTPTTGTPVDEACDLLPSTAFEWFVITNDDPSWIAPIDETCTVTATEPESQGGVELRLDCPQHAAEHGEFVLVLYSGPMPAPVPQPGDLLDVYFQPWVESFDDPHPQLVFLHSGGELLYASALGSFVDPNDAAAAAARYAPLTVTVEPGLCPLAANPFVGNPGLPNTCEQVAIAQLHVGSPDDKTRVLDEFTSDEIVVGTRTYTIQSMTSRHWTACGDIGDLEWFAHAIALKSAP